jgi:hypothetical protein
MVGLRVSEGIFSLLFFGASFFTAETTLAVLERLPSAEARQADASIDTVGIEKQYRESILKSFVSRLS